MKPKFEGQTIFITGPSSGIGEAIARELALPKYKVKKLVFASRDLTKLNKVKSACLEMNKNL